MRHLTIICQTLLSAICLTCIAGEVSAKQTFKDEAGQLLYSIDDQGIVSMFENSPGTDVTLSVTRDTREQMQPQVTEVKTEAVAASSVSVLKLRCNDLLGATVKPNGPSIRRKAY